MQSAKPTPPRPLGCAAYVVGGMSFIPLLGILFGISSIVWGVIARRRGGGKLALVGALGIGFSLALYSGLFYFGFVQRGGVHDDLRRDLATTLLGNLVEAVEFYKVQHGRYPASLEELATSLPEKAFKSIYDPSVRGEPREFYYERLEGDVGYYLLGVGPDGVPFTPDDILPRVPAVAGSQLGMRIRSSGK
jgi:hypothetical protein